MAGVGRDREGQTEFAVGAGGGVLAGSFDGDSSDRVVLFIADGALEGGGFGGEAIGGEPSGWNEDDGGGSGGEEGAELVAASMGGEEFGDLGGGVGRSEGMDVFEVVGEGCAVETPGEDGFLGHQGELYFGLDPVGGGGSGGPAEGEEAGVFDGIAELGGPGFGGAETGGVKEDFEAQGVAGLLELPNRGQVFA